MLKHAKIRMTRKRNRLNQIRNILKISFVKLVLTMPAYTEYPLYKLTCAHTRTMQATHTLYRFGGNKTHELIVQKNRLQIIIINIALTLYVNYITINIYQIIHKFTTIYICIYINIYSRNVNL